MTEDRIEGSTAPSSAGHSEGGPVHSGTKLADRYLVGEVMGRGGMATVFRGRDELLTRDVAVKVFAGSSEAGGTQQEFLREARAAAALSHPNIAGVFDVGVHGPERYIVMEFVPGGSLADLLQADDPISPRRAIQIVAQLADALDYGHRHGIVHCDVKPQNVLMDESGRPKLVDFGISRSTTATTALTETVSGTAGYIAPEQLLGDSVDGRTDIYALGCVAYELLSGELPFDGSNLAALATQRLVRPPVSLQLRNPDVPAPVAEAVMHAIRRDPNDRYATGQEFARAIRVSAASLQPGAAATRRNQTVVLPGNGPGVRDDRFRGRTQSRRENGGRTFWLLLVAGLVALAFAGAAASYWLPSLTGHGGEAPVAVPAVKNERLDTAAQQLHDAGFTIAVTFQDSSGRTPCNGIVLDQVPAAPAMLGSGGTVQLVVSRNNAC